MNLLWQWRAAFMLVLGLALSGFGQSLFAAEEIIDYTSDISIHTDRSMTVIETISVSAEGRQIRRGIYRDFPTDYKDRFGNRYRVEFDVLSVSKDGAPEPFHTERRQNGVRVYIGSENVTLTPGTYRFAIEYRTNRQLGFFETHDELYWNVTGTEWAFPIISARAIVRLPTAVDPATMKTAGYTGAQGSREHAVKATIDDRGVAEFVTTRRLGAREGLTIVLGWPKGIIPEPSPGEQFSDTLNDNKQLIVALLGSLGLVFYYLLTWNKFGRDPQAGVVVARYEPPAGYSPASMRYIDKMDYDHTCFSAAIINLAVKGFLTIDEYGGEYTLTKTGNDVDLAPGEAVLIKHLFKYDKTATLKKSNHKKISNALERHEQVLSNDYENIYFKTNSTLFGIGVVLSVAVILGAAVMSLQGGLPETLFMTVWSSIWWFGIGSGLIQAWNSFRHSSGMLSRMSAILRTVFLVPFVAVGIFALVSFGGIVNWSAVIFLVFIVALNMVFYQLLKAPTRAGRKLLDQVDGFRHYVDIAEKHELNYKNPEGRTPELFERFLPYALALGIEQQWAEQFDDVIAAANQHGEHYRPSWYSGSHWDAGNIRGFTSAVGGSLSSAVASSSTAPGSSSGFSGGGGSSGGGGGGGGGGGW